MGEKNSVVSEVKLESKSFFPLALCLLMREGAVPPCVCSESPMTKAVWREDSRGGMFPSISLGTNRKGR